MGKNQQISVDELAKIRRLNDFDLTMLISEVHDHGWTIARKTLAIMPESEPSPGAMFDRFIGSFPKKASR